MREMKHVPYCPESDSCIELLEGRVILLKSTTDLWSDIKCVSKKLGLFAAIKNNSMKLAGSCSGGGC